MVEHDTITHHIQRHIILKLMYQEVARFRDLRPPRVDTNLYSYHLTKLIKNGLVKKTDDGYTLSLAGLTYVDRVSSEKQAVRTQPKIITMLVVQNSNGDVLLHKRGKQPFINSWTLPYGKLHIDDTSIAAAAQREAQEKLGLHDQTLIHAGDCYIRVREGDELLSTTLAHVFTFTCDAIVATDTIVWARPHKLHEYKLAPAVEQIIARTFFHDPFYFEEFEATW